jgi:hypothetical protein
MLPTITKSVGMNGVNRPEDVRTVQRFLNAIPVPLGGPQPKLATDSLVGPHTIGAIRRFQQTQLGFQDGRVDPNQRTIGKLGELLALLRQGADRVLPGLMSRLRSLGMLPAVLEEMAATLPAFRLYIILLALGETLPIPGKVSDQDKLVDTDTEFPFPRPDQIVRAGWRRLKEYFDEAAPGYLQMKRIASHRDGIKVPTLRVRLPNDPLLDGTGRPYGVHWCGLFATWVYRKALQQLPPLAFGTPANVRWMWPRINIPIRYTTGKDGVKPSEIQPGDVCVIENGFSHHFIAMSYADLKKNEIWSINGNSTSDDTTFTQSVLFKKQPLGKLSAVYSADGALTWNY